MRVVLVTHVRSHICDSLYLESRRSHHHRQSWTSSSSVEQSSSKQQRSFALVNEIKKRLATLCEVCVDSAIDDQANIELIHLILFFPSQRAGWTLCLNRRVWVNASGESVRLENVNQFKVEVEVDAQHRAMDSKSALMRIGREREEKVVHVFSTASSSSGLLFYECFTYNYTHLHAWDATRWSAALIFSPSPSRDLHLPINPSPVSTGPTFQASTLKIQCNLIGIQSLMISSLSFAVFFAFNFCCWAASIK